MKKISGWYRRFIVFAGVWTVMSIGLVSHRLYTYNVNVPYPTIESTEGLFETLTELRKAIREHGGNADDELDELDVQGLHKRALRNYYEERRSFIFVLLRLWLAPIGFVYGAGWVIRGFRKEK